MKVDCIFWETPAVLNSNIFCGDRVEKLCVLLTRVRLLEVLQVGILQQIFSTRLGRLLRCSHVARSVKQPLRRCRPP